MNIWFNFQVLKDTMQPFQKIRRPENDWKEINNTGRFAYLIISVAVVCLLWFQIPQDHNPRLKSNYKLQRKSNRHSVRHAGGDERQETEQILWWAETEVIHLISRTAWEEDRVKGLQWLRRKMLLGADDRKWKKRCRKYNVKLFFLCYPDNIFIEPPILVSLSSLKLKCVSHSCR